MACKIDVGSCQLTFEQLQRLHRSLCRYCRKLGDPNIVAVGFGPKERAGRRSPQHPLAARFLVTHKGKPRHESQSVPPTISLRLRLESGKYQHILLTTDVKETSGRFVRTGTSITAGRSATSGVTIAWLPRGLSEDNAHWQWGLFTVGHVTQDEPVPIHTRIRRLESGPDSPTHIAGSVRKRTSTGQAFDAAVIETSRSDLLLSGFIPDLNIEWLLRDNATLAVDAAHQAKGKTLRIDELGTRAFRVVTFHPEGQPSLFDNLRRVLVVEGDDHDFAPGTSGSLWTIDGVPAAIQVGAFAPQYRIGVGQSLISGLFDWARPRLDADRISVSHVF